MADIKALKSKLLARQTELSDILNRYIADHEGKQTVESFIEVADIGEKSVDDFLKELELSVINQEVKEIKAINAALRRMDAGEYGRKAKRLTIKEQFMIAFYLKKRMLLKNTIPVCRLMGFIRNYIITDISSAL